MVKSTYAVTLFAALSMAAPMAPTSNEYTGVEPMRRDGTGNLLGAGADGALNSLVGQLDSNLKKQNADLARQKTPKQKTEVAEAAKKQKPSILQSLPLLGEFLKGEKRSIEEAPLHTRSLTGDLSNFPILGELFGGAQDKNQNTNKPLGNGDAMPGMSARSYEHAGQNYGQNYGQNAGQNEGQNAGQNWMQNYGQNEGQNQGQNEGQNWLQNYAQNHRRDLTSELGSLPLIGSLLGGQKNHAARRDNQAKSESLDILSLVKDLTSGGSETISHRRRQDILDPEDNDYANLLSSTDILKEVEDAVSNLPMGLGNTLDETEAPGTITRRDFFDLLKTPQELAEEQQAGKAQKAKEGDKAKDEQKPAQDNKKATENTLKEIFSQSGLGGLVGNGHHGVGLLPMNGRRDVSVEARGQQPIEGATLPDFLLEGGVLGKIAEAFASGGLGGAAPAGH